LGASGMNQFFDPDRRLFSPDKLLHALGGIVRE
jgi:hypothetical protein